MNRIYYLSARDQRQGGGEGGRAASHLPKAVRQVERGLPKVEARLKETSVLLAQYQKTKQKGEDGEHLLADAIQELLSAVEVLQDEMLGINQRDKK